MTAIKPSLTIILFFVTAFASSQSTEKPVELIQSQTIYVNSAVSLSGKSRKVISFQLPANTIRWYYCFSTFRNEQDVQNVRNTYNLFSKLSLIIDQSGTTASAISLIGTPPGTNYCDVYLLSSSNDVSVFESKSDYLGSSYYYNRQGSRQNFVSGVVDVTDPSNLSGWQYLGLKNTDLNDGVNVVLQVVAIVYSEPSTNGWTVSVKQQVYEKLKSNMTQSLAGQVKQSDIENLSGCIMSKLTQNYTPQQISALAEYELKPIFAKFGEGCYNELGLDFSNVTPVQTVVDPKKIVGKWRDQNSTFSIMDYGMLSITWDNGKFAFGNWKIDGSKLQFSFDYGKRIDNYLILELSDTKLRYKGECGDATIWEATKQGRY